MISGPAHSARKTWAKAETLKKKPHVEKANESRALRTESRNPQNVDQLCNENIWQDRTACLWLLLQLLCQGRLKLSATSPDCQHSQRYLTCANEATEAPSTFYNTSSPQMRWLSEAARLEMKAIPESAPWALVRRASWRPLPGPLHASVAIWNLAGHWGLHGKDRE